MSNADYGEAGQGIGRRQAPGSTPPLLEPGLQPSPSEGYEGPPVSVPIQGWEEREAAIVELGRRMGLETRPDTVAGVATGSTDSNGLAYIGLYTAAAGMEARLHRLTVNAVNPTTAAFYTAASTYSNSAAYLEIHAAASPQANDIDNAHGSLLDFAPPTAGGPIFPGLFTDNSMQASFARGPMGFVLKVVTGPASTLIVARYQIRLSRAVGAA